MSETLTTLHLVRHGEVHNPGHVLYERAPGFHLSDRGKAMAGRVAAHFATFPPGSITAIYASPLERAQETAEPIAAVLGLAIETEPDVIEAQSAFAGMVVDLPHLLVPTSLVKLRNPLRPTWGEPYEQIARRMHQVIAKIRSQVAGSQAVIVSHQSPIWRARLRAEGRPIWPMPRGRRCSLASITSLTYGTSGLVAVGYKEPAAALLPPELR